MYDVAAEAYTFLQVVLVNVVLSGDNALVIAMAARQLPERQRRAAMFWGTFFAVACRLFLTFVVSQAIAVPGLRFVGGVLLAWIACKLLQDESEGNEESTTHAGDLRSAIGKIAAADLIMSLDNVLAVAGVSHSNPVQMVIGLALSIAIMIACSSAILAIMDRYRWIVYGGTAVLALTAAQMIYHDIEALPAVGQWVLPAWAGWAFRGAIVAACFSTPVWRSRSLVEGEPSLVSIE